MGEQHTPTQADTDARPFHLRVSEGDGIEFTLRLACGEDFGVGVSSVGPGNIGLTSCPACLDTPEYQTAIAKER